MEYLLFVFYLVLFAWLITKVRFYKTAGLSKSQLIIFFLLKIIAGIFYGWIGIYYGGLAQMWDTWGYHQNSVLEFRLLFDNPHAYFTNLFYNPYKEGFTQFLSTTDSYWNDLKGNFLIKVLSVFNLFSFENYYVNIIFLSFITFLGPLAIFRVMNDVFPNRKMVIMLGCFIIPSFLFWSSGIHKEGLIFTGIGLITYCIYFATKQKKLGIKRILGLIIGFLLVITLRNFIIIVLVPAIITWLIALKVQKKSLLVFSVVYVVFILLFFNARHINPMFDFPQAVVNKQQEFINIVGTTSFMPEKLEPTAVSFLKNSTNAFCLSILRPYPSDVKHFLSLASSVEVIMFMLLFVLFIFFRRKHERIGPFFWFCIFFSITLLLSIGFSVNNLGAIVRYRSVTLPLLIVPIMALTDWKAIWGRFQYIINKINVIKF